MSLHLDLIHYFLHVFEQVSSLLDVLIRNRAVYLLYQALVLDDQVGLLAELQEVALRDLVLLGLRFAFLRFQGLGLADYLGGLASGQLLGAAFAEVLQFEKHLFLKLLLIVLKLGPLLYDLLEEDVVLVLAEDPLRKLFILGLDGQPLLVVFFLEVLLDDLPMLLPQLLLAVVDLSLIDGTVLDQFLLLLRVASLKPLGYFDGIEPLERQFDLAGGGVVLAGGSVVVVIEGVEFGEVFVGMRMVEVLHDALVLRQGGALQHLFYFWNLKDYIMSWGVIGNDDGLLLLFDGVFVFVINIRLMSDNQRIDQHVLNRYKVTKKIGSGAYGHVWKVTANDRGNDVFALKKVFEAFQHATDAQRTFREISILKKIQHPNIVKLFQVIPSVSERDIYLLFEFVNTDVYHAIYEGALEQIHKKYIVYQLLLGLYYLHSAHLLHRDLKPSNLLLNQQCQLKICDFGLVRHLDAEIQEDCAVLTEGVATKWYRAPEILLGSQRYNEKVDMWSVGCILAQMAIKNPLFNCNSTISHIEKIIQVTGRPTFQEVEEIGGSTETILKQCTSKQKSPKQLFGAHIDDNCLDLLLNLLKFSSSRRFSALQALKHPYFKEFFKESDLKSFKGDLKLETDDNVKLPTEAYRDLILKHFIEKRQPQRFSDLRRGQKSFGRVLTQMNSRKSSNEKDNSREQRKNLHLFQQILRGKQNSLKHNSRNKSNTRDKENIMANKQTKEGRENLEKFSNLIKPSKSPGTFAALRKVNAKFMK